MASVFPSVPRWRAAPIGALPSLVLLGLVAAMISGGVRAGVIGYDHGDLDPMFTGSLGLWCVAIALRRLSADRVGAFIQLALLLLVMAAVTALASVLLARSALPYADAWLAMADRHLIPWLDWPAAMKALQHYPRSLLLLAYVYVSLGWQPFVFVAIACAIGREALAWRFATAWCATLVITLLLFPLVPATGAYVHFGLAPTDVPAVRVMAAWDFLPLMRGARSGAVHVLNSGTMRGIITMPSFHAAGAVVLGWAFARLRYVRWFFVVLNGAMIVSAVPIGGHYCVDVLAGIVVALLGIALANGLHRRLPPSRKHFSRVRRSVEPDPEDAIRARDVLSARAPPSAAPARP